MKTLIIYDLAGRIIFQGYGNILEPVGLPFMWVDVPEAKYVQSIDVSGEAHKPVFADLPKTEAQLLKEQVDEQAIALAALIGGAV